MNLNISLFPDGAEVETLSANAGDASSIPEVGRSPVGGNGNSLQYSCLKNCMDIGALQAYSPRGPRELDMTERTHSYTLGAGKKGDNCGSPTEEMTFNFPRFTL